VVSAFAAGRPRGPGPAWSACCSASCRSPDSSGLGLGLLAFLFAALGLGRVNKGQATIKEMTITALILSVLAIVIGFVAMRCSSTSSATCRARPNRRHQPSRRLAPTRPTRPRSHPRREISAGQTADRDGLQITADPLDKVKPQYLDPVLCTNVSYINNSGSEQRYNAFDWKLQDPNGNIANPTCSGKPDLPSGSIAPGGKVARSADDRENGG